jgi:hypothetical protein
MVEEPVLGICIKKGMGRTYVGASVKGKVVLSTCFISW